MELYEKSGVGVQPRGFRYHLCFFLDLAFRLVIATLLVAILATVAWKTLAPVPALPAWLG